MFEKYDQFSKSLSAPTACPHCGQATPHHNYYPHFAAIAVISSVATMLAFAIPMILQAQTATSTAAVATSSRPILRAEVKPLPKINNEQARLMAEKLRQNTTIFKQRIETLKKQGLAIPSSTAENLLKVKNFLTENNSTKKLRNLASSSVAELQLLKEQFDQEQNRINLLNRWHEIQLQLDRETASLNKILTRAKTISQDLKVKGADVSNQLQSLEEIVAKLKAVRQATIPIDITNSSVSP